MTEMVLYSEAQRDEFESREAAERNKVDLMERRGDGMVAILYHLMRENVSILYVEDERTASRAEFEIPNEGCLERWRHAFAERDADLKPYRQNQNADGYGA